MARSLQATAPQVSAYFRLSSPPNTIPGYVRLDPSSEWSKSALLCAAVETVTLPTRLTESNGRPSSLSELESTLNRTGSRSIFELKASVVGRDGSGRHAPGEKSLRDENPGDVAPTATTAFDLDYSPRGSQSTLGRTPHIFSQVEIRRCIPKREVFTKTGGSDDKDAIVEM